MIATVYAHPTEPRGADDDIQVVGIDTDGCAIYADLVSGERWNDGVHFLSLDAM